MMAPDLHNMPSFSTDHRRLSNERLQILKFILHQLQKVEPGQRSLVITAENPSAEKLCSTWEKAGNRQSGYIGYIVYQI